MQLHGQKQMSSTPFSGTSRSGSAGGLSISSADLLPEGSFAITASVRSPAIGTGQLAQWYALGVGLARNMEGHFTLSDDDRWGEEVWQSYGVKLRLFDGLFYEDLLMSLGADYLHAESGGTVAKALDVHLLARMYIDDVDVSVTAGIISSLSSSRYSGGVSAACIVSAPIMENIVLIGEMGTIPEAMPSGAWTLNAGFKTALFRHVQLSAGYGVVTTSGTSAHGVTLSLSLLSAPFYVSPGFRERRIPPLPSLEELRRERE